MSLHPQHPSAQPDAPPSSPTSGRRRPKGSLLLLILLVIALAAAGTVAVVQTARLSDARAEVTRLEAQAEEDAARIEQLREALERPQVPSGGDPFADLFGEGGLQDLLGEGGLEDLLGEGGLDDLLGGEGGLGDLFGEDGLGGLFGESALGPAPDVSACTQGVSDLPDVGDSSLQAQFDDTTAVVEQLRGQQFPEPLAPEVLSGDEIRDFFSEEIAEAYTPEEVDAERRVLGMLQATPDDIDLVATQTELLGDQVAGFYDDETGQLVVRADDPSVELTGTGLITLAHELEHALVDATIGLPPLDAFDTDDDGAIAALSVVEGSAVGLQSQFQLAALDPLALFADLGSLQDGQQGLEDVPALIRESLLFPYIAGPTYVCGLYADGGWDAVDDALRSPPATTHQILFPGDGVGTPTAVPEPQGPPDMDLLERRSFGAAQLSWLFTAPGDDPARALADPVQSARAWRGGEVSLWTQGEDSAVALVLAGADLCQPVTAWWQAAADGPEESTSGSEQVVRGTGEGTWGVVTCDGEDVRVGVAPTVEAARQAVA